QSLQQNRYFSVDILPQVCLIYSVFTNGRHMKLVKLKKDTKRWLSSYGNSGAYVKQIFQVSSEKSDY
ncbi:hypothetical protein COA00_30955, partial [Bacillus cereus]|uniref:hypothetical protein n=1 Tax=Bacillus cereus TaxID=1396 RepID=UPI000BFAB7B0